MLNLKTAHEYQRYALEKAQTRGVAIAIAITDSHGELVSFAKMDGVAPHAAVLAQNKAYTSARDRQPTMNLAKWAKETGKDLGYWSDNKITGIAGGVPIDVDGQVIGAVGISGMSEEDDHRISGRRCRSHFRSSIDPVTGNSTSDTHLTFRDHHDDNAQSISLYPRYLLFLVVSHSRVCTSNAEQCRSKG